MIKYLAAVLCVLCAACGSGENSVTGPSGASPVAGPPSVAGSYSGSTTVSQSGRSVSCSTTTQVTQSGSTVNIAPLNLGGVCGNISIPGTQTTIDSTGNMNIPNPAPWSENDGCGVYTGAGSGGFFGRDMRLTLLVTSRCAPMSIAIVVSR